MSIRLFSKITCLFTLLLIFAGGMVTSTGSGLSVPDWPLSYGMVFPPMVGGVFYEHGHRMIAAFVGFLILCLALIIGIKEKREWVRCLAFAALGTVVIQGILGGITVLLFLPPAVSVAHGVLAQTFFLLTILIAYSQSQERTARQAAAATAGARSPFIQWTAILTILIFIQLVLGAVMRHTKSGLAIPDFPTMGGYWLPPFNDNMLAAINVWRFENNLDPVTLPQVLSHFVHRLWALLILGALCAVNIAGRDLVKRDRAIGSTVFILNAVVAFQILLGILTVLTAKAPRMTSLHVMTGAAALGLVFLLLLRSSPLSLREFKQICLKLC